MRKFIISMIISFLSLSVTANVQYRAYLDKVFNSRLELKRDFTSLKQSQELKEWLLKVDQILDTDKLTSYDAEFKFSLDHLGNIKNIEIVSLNEDNFEKFKNFITDISSINFPDYSGDLTNFNFALEASTLYIDRPFLKTEFELSASKTNDLLDKLGDIETDFVLHKPKYLDYPYLGQEIILRNDENVFLKTYVTKKKGSRISLSAFEAYNNDETKRLDLDLELKRTDDKNFTAKLIRSGFANGLKAGLINSYNTYGIAPGVLAIMGMAGTALIEHETEDSFSLEKGENLKIKKMEEK
jgi:hypothetical protein